jgi:predicted dehydrogenase
MRVLVVGLGGIGQRHVRNLRMLLGDRVQISAVRTRRLRHVLSERLEIVPGEDVERRYDIACFGDLEDALATRPDVVLITNPTSLHVPTALAAARRGCHLFIEKPLSHTTDGVEELVQVVEDQRLTTFVGYQLRFHPCFRLLVEALEQGTVGRVVAARVDVGEYLPGWHPYEDYRRMYASRRDLGGGVILSQIHEFDYLYRLFGLPKRVFALGGHLSRLEVDVEDTASTLLEYDGLAVHVHQDYLQRPPSRTCQVIGDSGKIIVDFLASSIRIFDATGGLTRDQTFAGFSRNQLFVDELSHFLACLREHRTPQVTVRDGAQSLRVALAARRSLETGQVMDVDSLAVTAR